MSRRDLPIRTPARVKGPSLRSITIRISLEWRSFELYTNGMTPNQLVEAVAVCTGLPQETVVQHDRNLLIAGLRTKGGRGPSAARVTYKDAARLLVATLGSMRVKDSADTVRQHETTAMDASRCNFDRIEMLKKIPPLRNLDPCHSFIDMVAALIEASADKTIHDYLPSKVLWPPVRVVVSYPWIEPEIIFFDDHPDFGPGKIVSLFGYRPALSGKPAPGIKKGDRADHDAWWRLESKARAKAKFSEPGFDVICIKQRRFIDGHSLVVLGGAFRDGGISVEPSSTKRKRAKARL